MSQDCQARRGVGEPNPGSLAPRVGGSRLGWRRFRGAADPPRRAAQPPLRCLLAQSKFGVVDEFLPFRGHAEWIKRIDLVHRPEKAGQQFSIKNLVVEGVLALRRLALTNGTPG